MTEVNQGSSTLRIGMLIIPTHDAVLTAQLPVLRLEPHIRSSTSLTHTYTDFDN